MLTTLLLAGLLAAPLGMAGLLMPAKRHAGPAGGAWRAIRRFVLAMRGPLTIPFPCGR